ncbi:disease resistance protein RPM1-like [Tasmannia lanceolata]|uniref:disease resistance protein RPM1-like n=1 Tax=Tasmannia lanceolata TaxID=3420 RepID=UPI004063A077
MDLCFSILSNRRSSQSLIKELFKENMEATPNEIQKMDYRLLVDTNISYLRRKRYVVILDDVWTMDARSQINVAFPDDKCGSKIMLTTRQEDVAFSSSSSLRGIGSHVFHLEPLRDDETLTLFYKKAFWNIQERRCPRELEPLARRKVL